MALVVRCNKNKEMIIQVGAEITVKVCIEMGQIKAVVDAPITLHIDKEIREVQSVEGNR